MIKDYLGNKIEKGNKVVYFTKQMNHQEFQKGIINYLRKDNSGEDNGFMFIKSEETGRMVERHCSEVIKIKE